MLTFFSAVPNTDTVVSSVNGLLVWQGIQTVFNFLLGIFVGFIILKIITKVISKPNK